jgi:hypothetical protein
MLNVTQLEDRLTPAPLVLPIFKVVEHPEIRSLDIVGYFVYDDGTGGDVRIITTPEHLIVNGFIYNIPDSVGSDWVLQVRYDDMSNVKLAGDWKTRFQEWDNE